MHKRFIFAREDQPDREWLDRFVAGRGEAERWYLGRGRAAAPAAAECRAALVAHMPELISQYDRVCALFGDDDRAQLLSICGSTCLRAPGWALAYDREEPDQRNERATRAHSQLSEINVKQKPV